MAYTTANVPAGLPYQYEAGWLLEKQQKSARARAYVDTYPVTGLSRRFNKAGKISSTVIAGRYGDTNPGEATADYRTLKVVPHKAPIRLDAREMMQLAEIGDMRTPTIKNQMAAYGRSWDRTLYEGITGTAWGGEQGDVAVPWNTDNDVAVNFVYSGSPANSGLTFSKLTEVLDRLGDAHVTGQDVEDSAPIIGLVTQRQITDLRHEIKLTSGDYQAIKPLAGFPNMYDVLGIRLVCIGGDIIRTSSDVRECVFYARDSVAFGITEEFNTSIDRLIEGNMDWQLWASWFIGATRIEDAGVIKVYCDESPA